MLCCARWCCPMSPRVCHHRTKVILIGSPPPRASAAPSDLHGQIAPQLVPLMGLPIKAQTNVATVRPARIVCDKRLIEVAG